MFPWQEILRNILQGMITVYFQPIFLFVLGFVTYLYWRARKEKFLMFGVSDFSLRHQVLLSVLYGGLGGIVASILLALLGVTLSQVGLGYIWPLAVLLTMIDVRFMCFSYAGGIVALSCILFGWPHVEVPQVLALIGVLHVTESLLIYISGRYSAQPLALRQEDGRIVGAFKLQNFWPLPLVVLSVMGVAQSSLPHVVINTPDWWPLITMTSLPPLGQIWLYSMVPVVAALGYSDIAVSSTPTQRRRRSAFHLAIYSVVLTGVALLSSHYTWLQLVAALLSPLGHELLIQQDNRQELERPPRFVPPEQGVMVLDTLRASPGAVLKLQPGDIILNLDGSQINNGFDLAEAINATGQVFIITILREGLRHEFGGHFPDERKQLGVILVPVGHEQNYVRISTKKYVVLEWLKGRFPWGKS
jgi:hypothetical protein